MLIPSERLTAEDLQLWAEYEKADRIHGAALLSSSAVEKSLVAIRRFAEAGPCYAGWSGGKDSTVLAHLIAVSGLPIPIVYVRAEPVANPLNDVVRDALLGSFPALDFREIKIHYAEVFLDGRDNPAGDRLFFSAFRQAGERHLSGIRAEESGVRKIRMRRWGLATERTCAPIGWWSTADVFGYLDAENLPVHPNYAMLGGGRYSRGQLRVDELAGQGGNNYGRAEWEREYYGDVLRRMESRNHGRTDERNGYAEPTFPIGGTGQDPHREVGDSLSDRAIE